MSLEIIPKSGLKASERTYTRLKAFHGGGLYWDNETQQLIRSSLGQFLPTVVQSEDGDERYGLFKYLENGRDILWKSVSVGSRKRAPSRQLESLETQLAEFRQKAELPEVTPNNKEIILQFKLPDFESDPDLYRLSGPFWNRRLFVLWGCESKPDSSLKPSDALQKVPSDRWYALKRWLLWLFLLALLLGLLWFLIPRLKQQYYKLANKPPVALLSLTGLDETNRVATVSDKGSYDPDGVIQQWLIDWGDGNHQSDSNAPSNLNHKYLKDGNFDVSLICIDNLGAQSPASLVKVHLDLENKLKAAAEKARAARQEAELKAQQASDELAAKQAAVVEGEAVKQKAELEAKRAKDALAAQKAEADAEQLAKDKAELEEKELADRLKKQKAADNAKAIADDLAKKESPIPDKQPAEPTPPVQKKKDDLTKAGPDSMKALEADKGKLRKKPNSNSVPSLNQNPTNPKGLSFHIEKVSNKLLSDGTMEVKLAARDGTGWNIALPIAFWQVDGKKFPGGPEFIGNLTVGKHAVNVHTSDPNGQPLDVSADVIISIEELKEGNVVVTPPN